MQRKCLSDVCQELNILLGAEGLSNDSCDVNGAKSCLCVLSERVNNSMSLLENKWA